MIAPLLKNTITVMNGVIQCLQRKKEKRSQVFHISINHNIIAKHEKGKQDQVKFIQQTTVNEILNDIAYDQPIGISRFH